MSSAEPSPLAAASLRLWRVGITRVRCAGSDAFLFRAAGEGLGAGAAAFLMLAPMSFVSFNNFWLLATLARRRASKALSSGAMIFVCTVPLRAFRS